MPFGPCARKTLEEIAHTTDEGLHYLNCILEALQSDGSERADTLKAIRAYLSDPVIASELLHVSLRFKERPDDCRIDDHSAERLDRHFPGFLDRRAGPQTQSD